MKNSSDVACEANRLAAQVRADWLERVAFGASFLCLIHCLALPIVISALPALSRMLALPENIHAWLLVLAVPASTLALTGGGFVQERRGLLILGAAGIVTLASGALIFGSSIAETPITVAGSLMLAFAHLSNWRRRHARHRHV